MYIPLLRQNSGKGFCLHLLDGRCPHTRRFQKELEICIHVLAMDLATPPFHGIHPFTEEWEGCGRLFLTGSVMGCPLHLQWLSQVSYSCFQSPHSPLYESYHNKSTVKNCLSMPPHIPSSLNSLPPSLPLPYP